MKYCPQCKIEYTETWITFCSDDGTILVEEFSPPGDPNWDPRIRPPFTPPPSEQATQWLPRSSPSPGGWVAPDDRPPQMQPAWQPPPAPMTIRQGPSQGLAIASMVVGLIGLFTGIFCLGPIPGIAALIMGLVSLSQNKKTPERVGGKPFAIVGVVAGSISLLFYGALFLWVIISSIIFG